MKVQYALGWICVINPLLPEFSFPSILRYNLRQAPIVYGLINAALIGIFSIISYFKIEIFTLGSKRLI